MASISNLAKTDKPYVMTVLDPNSQDEYGDYESFKNSKGEDTQIVFCSPDDADDLDKIREKHQIIFDKSKKEWKSKNKKMPASVRDDLSMNNLIDIMVARATGYRNMDGDDDKPVQFTVKHFKDLLTTSTVIYAQVKNALESPTNFMAGERQKKEAKV